MYEVVEVLEQDGRVRVKAIVSAAEAAVLWFEALPDQITIDNYIDEMLRQRAAVPAAVSIENNLSCTPWQFRKALNALNLRETIESYVANSNNQDIKDGWEYALEINRYDALFVATGAALGKSEQELDALIALARSM